MKFAHILLLSTSLLSIEACIIKFIDEDATKDAKGIWDEVANPRNIDDGCECGLRPDGNLPWNVFVHLEKIEDVDTRHPRICTGTIIASNLILTSHKCLSEPDAEMKFYDIFKPKSAKKRRNVIYSVEDINVTSNFDIEDPGENFKVEDIIYNSEYAMLSTLKKRVNHDVVILKVAANFTSPSSIHRPICIPPAENPFEDDNLFKAKAVYYGAGRKTEHPIRNADSLSVPIYYALEELCDHTYFDDDGVTVLHGDPNRLCITFPKEKSCSPANVGSPLIVAPDEVSYLIGLSMDIKQEGMFENVFFTNIVAHSTLCEMVKYIEHHAKIHESKWCKAPAKKIDLSKHNFPNGHDFGKETWPPFGTYPWDNASQTYTRDETLNCRCGIANSRNGPSGRIVNGDEAEPYEFPWMVSITVRNLEGHPFSFGGTVINDRMILTAAHCVVDPLRVAAGYPDVFFPTCEFRAYMNSHDYLDDPERIRADVRAIHIHPNYLHSVVESCYEEINDVALLEIDGRLPFENRRYPVRPICLPEPDEYFPVIGKIATVAGWGRNDPDEVEFPDSLQKLQVPILDYNPYCYQVNGYIKYPDFAVNPGEIPILCAGYLNRWLDSAPGDSGGPLKIYDAKKRQWTQVGTVASGANKDLPLILPEYTDPDFAPTDFGTASIYEDVQRYQRFIDHYANKTGAKWCRTG